MKDMNLQLMHKMELVMMEEMSQSDIRNVVVNENLVVAREGHVDQILVDEIDVTIDRDVERTRSG
jgi:hypothetical protein